MKRALTIFLILFSLFSLFCEDGDATADKTEKEEEAVSDFNIDDVLEFGIEEEVSGLLTTLSTNVRPELMEKLLFRYETADISGTKVAFAIYFGRCEKIPQAALDLLYADAADELGDRKLRTTIFTVLAKHGGEREGELLIKLLDDDDKLIQNNAAQALSRAKDASIVPHLIERLELSDESDDKYLTNDLKSYMLLAFGELKAKEALPYLREVVKESSSNKEMLMYSMYALAKIGDIESMDIIKEQLKHREVRVQEYAGYALSSFESVEVLPILKKMLLHNNAKIRIYACQGLLLNNDSSSIKVLKYKFKKDPEATVRKEALKTLAQFGAAGVKAMEELKAEKKFAPSHLFYISEAVSKNPDEFNVPFLLALYKEAEEKEQTMIARTIVHCKSNKIDPILKEILASEDYLMRIGGIKAIYQVENSSLWPEVKALSVNDPVPAVKNYAKKMLNLKGME